MPAYPLSAQDPSIAARSGAIGQAPAGPSNYYALEYYKQLVPNSEATLPGSICNACEPKEIAPANTWTPLDLGCLWRNSEARSSRPIHNRVRWDTTWSGF